MHTCWYTVLDEGGHCEVLYVAETRFRKTIYMYICVQDMVELIGVSVIEMCSPQAPIFFLGSLFITFN